MNTVRRGRVTHLLALSFFLLAASKSLAGSFELPDQGARGSAQAEAFAAQADDASAIYYNPAGLTQLRGTNVSGGVYAVFPDWHFSGASGSQSMHLPAYVPHFYAETDFGLQDWRFGLGFSNTFGLNENWGSTGPLRTLVTKSHLYVYTFEPTVAYQFNEHFSAGVALDIAYGDLNLEHKQILGAPPIPEGNFRFKGNNVAFGASPGVMWKIDGRNTLAGFYHSPLTLNIDGTAQISAPGIPEIGPSSARSVIKLPQMAGIAYAVRPIEPLKLEADIVWSNWNVFDQVQLTSADRRFNGQTIPTRYHDIWSYRFGTQYDLTSNWALRAGYAFGTAAAPASTFSPLVPDANYHLFSVGVGYSTTHWAIDAAYQFIYRERRHISGSVNSPIVDGTWDNNTNALMLTFTAKF